VANAKRVIYSKLEASSFALFGATGLSVSLMLVFVYDLRIESWI
jgi:hypothetical protein